MLYSLLYSILLYSQGQFLVPMTHLFFLPSEAYLYPLLSRFDLGVCRISYFASPMKHLFILPSGGSLLIPLVESYFIFRVHPESFDTSLLWLIYNIYGWSMYMACKSLLKLKSKKTCIFWNMKLLLRLLKSKYALKFF